MGFIFTKADGTLQLNLTDEWNEDLEDAYQTINQEDAINDAEMQEDVRNILLNEE